MDIKEVYVTKGDGVDAHYVLMVNADGSLTFNWYNSTNKMVENEPIMVKKPNGCMMLEYGEKNLFGLRRIIPFLDKDGVLDSRWEKIK